MSGTTTPESGKESVNKSPCSGPASRASASNAEHAHVTGHTSPPLCSESCDLHTIFGFPLPETPWSTNEDRKLHPQKRAAKIKAWKEATSWAYIQQVNANNRKRALPPGIVSVQIPFKVRRRRDPHNYCGTVLKAVIDGLVNAGAWPDDTPEWVGHREPGLWSTCAEDIGVWVSIDHPDGWVLTDGIWKMAR